MMPGSGFSIARAIEKAERKKRGPVTAEIGLELGKVLGEQISRYAGKSPLRMLAGAVVTGLVLGAFPSLRSLLTGFFRKKK